MNWTRILIGGLASGLAIGIVELLFRGKARRGADWVIAFVSIGLMNGLVQNLVLPEIETERAMQHNPALAALEKLEPAAAAEVRGLLKEVSRSRSKSTEKMAHIRTAFMTAMKKHLPKASDDALVTLVQVSR